MSPSITVRWPLNEKAIVAWGGDTVESNLPHAIWSSERWAYDLFIEPADMGSKNLEDYGVYGKSMPKKGTVVGPKE